MPDGSPTVAGRAALPGPAITTEAWRPPARGVLCLHLGSIVAAGLAILWFARDQWFVTDEWDPIVRRSVLGDAPLGLLDPHNEHWSSLGILVYRAQVGLFGVRTYLPVMLVFVVVHVVAAHLLWRLMRRLGVDEAVAGALALLFAFLGSVSFELLFAWNLTFSVPIACCFGALLALPASTWDPRRDIAVWALLVLGLASSGVGLTVVVVLSAVALVRRGWRGALVTASVPLGVYLAWTLGWGSSGATGATVVPGALRGIPDTLWRSSRHVGDLVTGLDGAGIAMVVLLLAFVVWKARGRGSVTTAAVLALGAPLFFVITSLRRYGLFGGEWIFFPRYTYVAFALVVPLLGLALTELLAHARAHRRLAYAALGVVLAAVLVHQGLELSDAATRTARREQELKARLVAAAELVTHGAPIATDRPAADCCADLDVAGLRRLARDGDLPDVALDTRARSSARTHLQVVVGGGDLGASGPRPTIDAVRTVALATQGDCVVATTHGRAPTVRLALSGPSTVVVDSPTGGPLALWLVEPDDESTRVPRTTNVAGGPALRAGLAAGAPATIRVAAPGNLLVRLPRSASVRFCDASAATP